MKTSVGRLLTGVVALALLLGGFGLMQSTAQAQTASVDIFAGTDVTTGDTGTGVKISFILSCDPYPERTVDDVSGVITNNDESTTCAAEDGDNEFSIVASPDPNDSQQVEVFNTNLPRSGDGTGNDDNPRKFDALGDLTPLYAVSRTTDLRDNEIKAFSGNVIQVTYTPGGTLGVVKTLTVDNVKPTLVTMSPEIPLVVKGNTNITFSAELTDGGSGYTATNTRTAGINQLTGGVGVLAADTNAATDKGGVRLVVAGNVVALGMGDFEAIDGGWRVTKTINSDSILSIGPNTPWFFETRDRAGNSRRTSGGVAVSGDIDAGTASGTGETASVSDASVTDTRFIGNLPATTFTVGHRMKVTRGSQSKTVPISAFDMTSGEFTLTLTGANFFTVDENEPATDAADDDLVTPLRASPMRLTM